MAAPTDETTPAEEPAEAGGMPDMGSLLDMAMGLQQQMLAAQEQAATQVVEGQAGGGAVRIAMTGGGEFRSVTIAREAVDPDDVEMLQDLVLAALHDAVARVGELAQAANPMGGLDLGGLDFGNLDLGGLLGGLGGGALEVGELEAAADDDHDGDHAGHADDEDGGDDDEDGAGPGGPAAG